MNINDGTEPRQDESSPVSKPFKEFLNGVIEEREKVKLGDNDLENFNLKQLRQILYALQVAIDLVKEASIRDNTSTLETLYTFRMMIYNAIQKVKTK